MKRNVLDLEFFKHCAVKYNSVRLHFNGKQFTWFDYKEVAQSLNAPYYIAVFSTLKENGMFIDKGGYSYTFAADPIHYSFFEKHNPREYMIKNKRRVFQEEEVKKNDLQSLNQHPRPTSPKYPKENNFSVFSDAEIVAELRKRGYEVSAKKVIEL
jgi:hypothetical protein